MNWKINLLLLLLLWSCQDDKLPLSNSNDRNVIIEIEDLKSFMNSTQIKVLDFRSHSAYKLSHIENAMHISRKDITNQDYPYNGMMASKPQMEALLSQLGINTDDTIIIYDDNGMCESARLWWILKNYGHDKVKLLHGSFDDWLAAAGNTSAEIPKITPSDFKFSKKTNLKYYIDKEELKTVLHTNTVILDTRTIDEFTGATHKQGAMKPGRIPNSKHMDWADCINYNGNKRLKSKEELENIFKKLNINKTDSIILYCHSGVRSAHTTLVMTQLLGFENVKNYDGSWTEWSHFNDLPFENDHISLMKE